MKEFLDVTFALGVVITAILLIIVIKGTLVWLVWEFAIVPLWGAQGITFLQSCALSILASVLTYRYTPKKED